MRVKQIQEGQGLYLTLWEAQTEQVRVELQGQVCGLLTYYCSWDPFEFLEGVFLNSQSGEHYCWATLFIA